ncbi:hypothetical protein, partial [Mesorhizobium japonicum]|uniref:hypothetical protein n=1 Tax=Mesorhizobium japonicum TaxID=2066070 RepID=UPI003B5CF99A
LAAEEERLRLGRLGMRDRLAALVGSTPAVELRDGSVIRMRIGTIGRDWVSGTVVDGHAASCVVPLDAVAGLLLDRDSVSVSLAASPERPDALSRRLGLAFVLRDLCRRRGPVDVRTSTRALHGTIDRVGRDHLDLAEHDAGEPRRGAAVRAIRIVPFAHLLRVNF